MYIEVWLKKDALAGVIHRDKQVLVNVGGQARWLPTRAPKRKSPADRLWPYPFACELDAIEADDLRAAVRTVIEHHLPPDQLEVLKVAEKSEREFIAGLVANITKDRTP